jgi:hypothetical protein
MARRSSPRRFLQLLLLVVFVAVQKSVEMTKKSKEIFNSSASGTAIEQKKSKSHCQTLWFAGFYDGKSDISAYARYYAAALLSAQHSAPGLFQPVLLVGHLEEDRQSVPSEIQRVKDQFYHWVQEQGAIVIHRDSLTFQDVINQHNSQQPPHNRQGPFLRMDIPNIVQEHNLFNRDGICQHNDVVLYTDCDVLFVNMTTSSLEEAKDLVSGRHNNTQIVAYGPQSGKIHEAVNTGIMFFSVSKFGSRLKDLLSFGSERAFKFDSYDQGLMNAYFARKRSLRAILPLEWNYKAYWGQPTTSNGLPPHIIHFHGLKPEKILDCLASMDPESAICRNYRNPNHTVHRFYKAYETLTDMGFQADRGRLANQTLDQFNQYASSYDWDK